LGGFQPLTRRQHGEEKAIQGIEAPAMHPLLAQARGEVVIPFSNGSQQAAAEIGLGGWNRT
jgi:hypothetical protein